MAADRSSPDERAADHPVRTTFLAGHSLAERALLDSYRSDRLHHAWLIGGPQGVGKATLAWRFAKFLLAQSDGLQTSPLPAETLAVDPADAAVQRIVAGTHSDVVLLERQWNEKTKKLFSEIRVDDVRRTIGTFQRASSAGGYRVCIIDTAEDLNRSSANALLKLIEEPPPRSLFLILAHRPSQVMPTLLSRCRRLILSALEPAEVAAAVTRLGGEWAALSPDQIAAAAARSRGSVGRALELLSGNRLEREAAVQTVLGQLPKVDWRAVHSLADTVGTSDEAFAATFGAVLEWLDAQVHSRAGAQRPRDLAAYAEAWARARAAAREAEVLNLDKRPVLLGIFADLAEISRTA